MIKTKYENILNSTEDIIVQSVNFQGVMGAGLAKKLADKYPGIISDEQNYKSIINEFNFYEVRTQGIVAFYKRDVDSPFIANIYGQNKFGRDRRYTDYISLANGFMYVATFANEHGLTVAIPHGIGCGLGGGDWNIVKELIIDTFEYMEIETYIYEMKK